MRFRPRHLGHLAYKAGTAIRLIVKEPSTFFQTITKQKVPSQGRLIIAHSTPISEVNLSIFCHVFYEDFIPQFVDAISLLPKNVKVFVTTPSSAIQEELSRAISAFGHQAEIRLTPNRGRNFGPLLTEYRKEMLDSKFLIFVHSKKSFHSEKIGREWSAREYNLLLNPENLSRALGILEKFPNVGVVSPFVRDLIRTLNFRWGNNLDPILNSPYKSLLEGVENDIRTEISFPAGGMFLARTHAIANMLEVAVNYVDFPPEEGQIDGTLQHGIERLVGAIAKKNGFQIAEYSTQLNGFYS